MDIFNVLGTLVDVELMSYPLEKATAQLQANYEKGE